MINKAKTSCLLIHGFTSYRASLELLIPELEKRKVPWHYPILAGHNTEPADLVGKTWEHWQNDVRLGLDYLLQECERVVIVGLSMGALLALELAAKNPDTVSELVLLSPSLVFKNPLAKYTPQLKEVISRIPGISAYRFSSLAVARKQKTYSWFPAETFHKYWLRTQHFDSVLEKISQPTLIIHSRRDRLADGKGAERIIQTIKSTNKKIFWLEKSGHELLLDVESDLVVKEVMNFIQFN